MKFELIPNEYTYRAILEMRTLHDTPEFIVRKEKLQLPKKSNKSTHQMVYFANTSIDAIASILNNTHPMIVNRGNSYRGYYWDHLFVRNSIRSTRIKNPGKSKQELKIERITDYTQIKSNYQMAITPPNLNILHDKNFVYDMQPVIRLLKKQPKLVKISLRQRLTIMFDTIQYVYNQPCGNYTKGPIYVDMDEYNGCDKLSEWHIFYYLLLLMKKSEAFINSIIQSMNYQILFYTKRGYILVGKDDISRTNFNKFINYMKKLKPDVSISVDKVDKLIKSDLEVELGVKMGLTGASDAGVDDSTEPSKFIETVDVDEDTSSEDNINLIEKELAFDDSMKKSYMESIRDKRANRSPASLQRDKLLREKQLQLKLNGETLGELLEDIPVPPDIPVNTVSQDIVLDDDLKNVKFYNFEQAYNDELYDKDMARAITSFNDKSINVNVLNIEVTDASDELNFQNQLKVEMEDENRHRHTMTVNIPKLIENKFIYLNGTRRVIQKQFVGLPIIKTAPDTVQIVTNYNKLFITRMGTRFSPNMEKLKKLLNNPEGFNIEITRGNYIKENKKFLTCLEYDELASRFTKIDMGDSIFLFSLDLLKEELGDKFKEPTLEELMIGYKKKDKTPIAYKVNSSDCEDFASFMIKESMPDYYDEFQKKSSGKKYFHTKIKMMEVWISTIIILCYFEGLTKVVHKFNDPTVKFVDKKKSNDNHMYIQFSDGYLCYPMNNMEACIMFNGFTDIVTAQYSIEDMDHRETYLSIFESLLGSSYYAGGFINYYDFMIDFKTLDILKVLQYPEDIVSLIIFANQLLADNAYVNDIDPVLYRLRSNEIIPCILYRGMADSYKNFRKTANNANPRKLTIDPNYVVKQLTSLPTVEAYNRVTPIVEVKQFGLASMSGYRGMNAERAYTEEKRNYHDNMSGIVGISTDIAKNCGKERHLVLEPNVKNIYGMFDIVGRGKLKDLDSTKLMTAEEMIYPMGVTHDIANRTAMTSKQSCHAIPVMDQCPMLITNGVDTMIHYRTCNDFSYVAKQDGKVIDRNDDVNIMIIEYADGTQTAIDLDPKLAKNGGGGMYLQNKLDSTFKTGDTFKKDAILAFDKHFYKDTGVFGNKLVYGTLVKSVCEANYAEYEDSTWVTRRICKGLSSDITMKEKVVTLGANSNVGYIVNIGDRIKSGEDLIVYDTSQDDDMSELLRNIRTELQEDIIQLGKSRVTTKHDGIVTDIRIFSTVNDDELSPSLKSIVRKNKKHEEKRKKYLDKYDKNKDSVYRMGIYFDRPTKPMEPDQYGKIKGENVPDGVMIEFYVTYHDEISDGDKFAHMSANKATTGYMIPAGFEPYTEFRPYEELDIPIAPSAILQRGVPSILSVMLGYKVLIELKRKCYEILTGESWNDKMKRDRPYMDVHGKSVVASQEVNESVQPIEYDSYRESILQKISVLETVFDIEVSSTTGKYTATKDYCKGDIILSGLAFDTPMIDQIMKSKFTTSTMYTEFMPNVVFNSSVGAYIAKDSIYYGERLII